MIDPRRLRVLRAVAASGSVAAAAGTLRLTPPAVSQQLRALEREAHAVLLDRSGRRVVLTAAGRLLARHAERIDTQLREAERELAELTGRVAGPVRLAAFQSVMAPLVAPTLELMARTSPAIRPAVVERYGRGTLTALRRGAFDVVLTEYDDATVEPDPPGLALRRLFHDPYRLVVPQQWATPVADLTDLAGRPWVAGPPDTACDYALRRLAAAAGLELSIADECVEFPSVLALVAAGRGAALVPQSTVPTTAARVTVCPGNRLGGRRIAALFRAGKGNPSPATVTMLDALDEVASTL
jgi:DNA-binding transcriptional LysR family regulator